MKPPKIIYFICLLAWAGLLIYLGQFFRSSAKQSYSILAIISGLVIYFSFFCYKRFTYDRIPTLKGHQHSQEIEIREHETKQLCQIRSDGPVKLKIKLFCNHSEPDEKFSIQILDGTEHILLEDSYVPVFGKFKLDTQFAKKDLPLTIRLINETAFPRKVHYEIGFAEILERHGNSNNLDKQNV